MLALDQIPGMEHVTPAKNAQVRAAQVLARVQMDSVFVVHL